METSLTPIQQASNLPELRQLGESKMQSVLDVFKPLSDQLEAFRQPYEAVINQMANGITPELAAQAKRVRLDIVKVRTATDKARKAEKDFYLQAGRAIDSVAKLFIMDAQALEANLDEIEKHEERKEKARLDALQQERETELRKYSQDASAVGLCNMPNDVWQAYIDRKKADFEAIQQANRLAEIERERVAKIEALRWNRSDQLRPYYDYMQIPTGVNLGEISEDEFQQIVAAAKTAKELELEKQRQIQAENERLRLAAEQREKELAAERAKAQAEAKAKQDEIDRLQRIEDERKAKEEAERKAQELAAKKAAAAPDKIKLLALADQLLSFPMPEMATENGKAALESFKIALAEKLEWLKSQAESL